MSNIDKLKAKVAKFSLTPGVYRFFSKNGGILYIGRATALRRRVSQYFRSDLEPRLAEMVAQAADIKILKTETVLDAVVLEANLIKKYWPKYNIKDRDNRSFVYIVISGDKYPRPLIIRGQDLKKFPTRQFKIFGPYQSATLVKNALRLIRKIFPYSTCQPNSGKPCFDHQIGLCPGTCVGKITKKDYQKNIRAIVAILSGQRQGLIKRLQKTNPEQAQALKHLQDVTLITRDEIKNESRVSRLEGYDISHFSGKETYGAMTVFHDNEPAKEEYRLFKIKIAPQNDDLRALEEMLSRRLKHTEWPAPDLIMIDGGRPQLNFLRQLFSEKNVNIPLVGISKFGGDILVFPLGTGKNFKALAESLKPTLLRLRDEAHRFGNKASRRARTLIKNR